MGTATGITLNRYQGKEAIPFRGLIDFTESPIQDYGIQSFKRDNIVTYKPDPKDETTNAGILTTFTCEHTQPNTSRDWYISPFGYTSNRLTYLNQLELASLPTYILPLGARYVIGGAVGEPLQVGDIFALAWKVYRIKVNCTAGTIFDDPDNYEQIEYSDLGEQELTDRIVRVLTVPSTTILLTDGNVTPPIQELKYNAVTVGQDKSRYAGFLKAVERNREIEVQAYLSLTDFKYLSAQIQSGNRFTIPELGTDVYLIKIENYSPAIYGRCKLTFLAT